VRTGPRQDYVDVTWYAAKSSFKVCTSGQAHGVRHNDAYMCVSVPTDEWCAVRDAPSLSAWTAAIDRLRRHAQAEGRRYVVQHPAEVEDAPGPSRRPTSSAGGGAGLHLDLSPMLTPGTTRAP
jgi:hypothetical protein